MSIYSVNVLSDCLSVMLQKALLLMDIVILVLSYITLEASPLISRGMYSKEEEETFLYSA